MLPKIAFIRKPTDYTAGSGVHISVDSINVVGRLFSMNMKMIDAYMGTGSICTAVAANTKGTIVNEITGMTEHIRIGHPWGIINVYADLDSDGGVISANLERTARRIMEGYVYVRD